MYDLKISAGLFPRALIFSVLKCMFLQIFHLHFFLASLRSILSNKCTSLCMTAAVSRTFEEQGRTHTHALVHVSVADTRSMSAGQGKHPWRMPAG